MALNCNLNTMIQDSKCFRDGCLGAEDREAVEIFFKVQNLKAIGGTDFTGTNGVAALVAAAKLWQTMDNSSQLKAVELLIHRENALANGAAFNQNINAIKSDPVTKKALGIGTAFREAILIYLKCAINNAGKPD